MRKRKSPGRPRIKSENKRLFQFTPKLDAFLVRQAEKEGKTMVRFLSDLLTQRMLYKQG